MKSTRKWLAHELAQFAASLPPGSRVLDAGSGDQRYKPLFADHVYESADFEQVNKPYAKSTYVCDLAAIPVADATYDAIVFTQVMEHLSEPAQVLKELHRISKAGCRLFYSAPFYASEHEIPYDFYRYTQFGIKHLFSKSGFLIDDIHWLEGFAATAADQLRRIRRGMPNSANELGGGLYAWVATVSLWILKPAFLALERVFDKADTRFRYTKAGHPLNYIAIVRRPSQYISRYTANGCTCGRPIGSASTVDIKQ